MDSDCFVGFNYVQLPLCLLPVLLSPTDAPVSEALSSVPLQKLSMSNISQATTQARVVSLRLVSVNVRSHLAPTDRLRAAVEALQEVDVAFFASMTELDFSGCYTGDRLAEAALRIGTVGRWRWLGFWTVGME